MMTTNYAAAAAPLSRTQLNQYEKVGKRFGLTAVQVAQVYAFIDGREDLIRSLSEAKRVNLRAFREIARELGLRNFGADPKALIEAIRDSANSAAKFELENAELRKQVAALKDPNVRTPAQAILGRADAAYAAGNLDAAQSALDELIALRTGELTNAYEAWEAAYKSAVSFAIARGDLERVGTLNDEAEAARSLRAERRREADQLAAWSARVEEAQAWFDRGERLGRTSDYAKAVDILQNRALPLAPKDKSSEEWAKTKSILANALLMQSNQFGGEAATILIDEAINAYRDALTVYTPGYSPEDWAINLNNLGNGLRIKGERSDKNAAGIIFSESIDVIEQSMVIYSKSDDPSSWAMAQNNLGNSLLAQSIIFDGEERRALVARAANAFEDALTALSVDEAPQEWALTQFNIGNARLELSKYSGSEEVAALLDKTVLAYEKALTIYTKVDFPSRWATIQANLGDAIRLQAVSSGDDREVILLRRAVVAYENALTVHARAESPVYWAGIKINLGFAFLRQGELSRGRAAAELLMHAIKVYEDALTVFDPVNFATYNASVTKNLKIARNLIAERQGQANK